MLPILTRTRASAGAACLLAMLAGCGGASENNTAEAPAPSAPVLNIAKAIPLPEPDLDREALLLAAIRAASAYSAGRDDRQAQASLAGRQFNFRVRFGCHGPDAPEGGERESEPESEEEERVETSLGWTYDPETQRLRLRAAPDLDSEQPQVQAVAGDGFEAIQGFWVQRPWLLENACPASPAAPEAPPTLGIAHFFTGKDSRARPRTRAAYESVQRLASDALPGAAGFELVLRGRLTALPDGRVIRCATSEDSPARPVCLVSAEFDRVTIENGATGAQLAEWGRG